MRMLERESGELCVYGMGSGRGGDGLNGTKRYKRYKRYKDTKIHGKLTFLAI